MDIISLLLVFVWLSHDHTAEAELGLSTGRPQPAPSAVTTEFDGLLIRYYSLESNKRTTERPGTSSESSAISSSTSLPSTPSSSSTTAIQKDRGTVTQQLDPNTTTTSTSETNNTTTTSQPSTVQETTTNSLLASSSGKPIIQPLLPPFAAQPHCTLGDETFQIGERWNPNLPPFGVQVCVLCECTIRPRKNCYEAKVTCKRITNECPVIDSCPDGKKPVTVAGQCCKSCQSTSLPVAQQEASSQIQQQQPQTLGSQSPAYESQAPRGGDQRQAPFKIVYMNERTKEYLSLVKNLPACANKDSEIRSTSSSAPTTPLPILPAVSKAPKGNRNDLNGIDTRLAFKSLHDTATNYLTPSKSRQEESSSKRLEHSSSEDDHQHPNDVQSASSSNNSNNLNQQSSHGQTKEYNSGVESRSQQQSPSPRHCMLGNDTFQVGDVWNPILPPFGVQVCVQCNCIFRARKGCYETKVTCRRVNKDCPVIDSCPDGKTPVTVSGQCCKSCPTQPSAEQQTVNNLSSTVSPYQTLDGIQRNERVYREFQSVSRNLNVCLRTRESVDIYNTNRYARRSR